MSVFIVSSGVIIGVSSNVPDIMASGETTISTTVYAESTVGAAPVWPRQYRTSLLAASDWTQLPDVALTSDQVSTAKTYRAALRDLPATDTSAVEITWPTAPTFLTGAA